MKQIESIELAALTGGAAAKDCMSILQDEANTHQSTGNQDLEDKYWVNWADRYYDCVGVD